MSSFKRALRQFTFGAAKTAGRNSSGRITSFHRGGGAKRLQRTLDLKRNTASSVGVVERLEHDPNRSSKIALVRWVTSVHLPKRRTSTATVAAPSSRFLQLDPAASNGIRGVLPLNSMLPREGTTSRDVFFSVFK